MPKLHKIVAVGDKVEIQLKEWDGLEHQDLTVVAMGVEDAVSALTYLHMAVEAAGRNAFELALDRMKQLDSEERQCRQRLTAIDIERTELRRRFTDMGKSEDRRHPPGRVVGFAVDQPTRVVPPTARVGVFEVTTS